MAADAPQMAADAPPGDRPLYGRMMTSISAGHTFGNRVRMLKLPMISAEPRLYAGAIAQFFWLTEELEAALARHAKHPIVARVRELGLCATPGYASDLEQLYGKSWREVARRERTAATAAYCAVLAAATPLETAAAAFILYGALVVGGGKATQAKVRRVIPGCDHVLFDIAPDIKEARKRFKACFTSIGREWPEHADDLAKDAARFMGLNVRATSQAH